MILTPAGHLRIFLLPQPVDFRKGLDGLAGVVATSLGHDPFDGSIYVFSIETRGSAEAGLLGRVRISAPRQAP